MDEKVVCYDRGGNDMAMLANSQWMNNPFAYMMILGMMRFMYGDNWQNGGANAEMNARFNQLSSQMADNHNSDILNEAIKGNTSRIGELANNLNVDLRAIQTGICDIRSGIQSVAGDVRFSSERVINAVNMGDTNIISKMMECCCENKQLVTTMGYEGQLRDQSNTASIIGRIDSFSNGVQQGFASIGYQQNVDKCDIINAINASQQRTSDLLNGHWKEELAKEAQDLRFQLSQKEQNEYLLDKLSSRFGCNCN